MPFLSSSLPLHVILSSLSLPPHLTRSSSPTSPPPQVPKPVGTQKRTQRTSDASGRVAPRPAATEVSTENLLLAQQLEDAGALPPGASSPVYKGRLLTHSVSNSNLMMAGAGGTPTTPGGAHGPNAGDGFTTG